MWGTHLNLQVRMKIVLCGTRLVLNLQVCMMIVCWMFLGQKANVRVLLDMQIQMYVLLGLALHRMIFKEVLECKKPSDWMTPWQTDQSGCLVPYQMASDWLISVFLLCEVILAEIRVKQGKRLVSGHPLSDSFMTVVR